MQKNCKNLKTLIKLFKFFEYITNKQQNKIQLMSTITKKKTKSQVEQILQKPFKLILGNDDFNTFDWVITCLMKICGHEFEQASQCAHIVHHKGECDVKYGDFDTLSVMKEKLQNAGLCVTLEAN